MLNLAKKSAKAIGIDGPILMIAIGRVWSMLSGPITIYLLTSKLSPVEQGYYYTFASVTAMQIFLELGFAQCIVQFTSHEYAKLNLLSGGQLEGDSHAKSRLLSLVRLSIKWYAILAIIVGIGLAVGGTIFFSLKHQDSTNWQLPWLSVSGVCALSFILLPIWAILEGCNQLKFTGVVRLLNSILGSVLLWSALLLGAGLYSGPILGIISFCALILIFAISWKNLWKDAFSYRGVSAISWRKEIWPFQWKIAVSSISGYFTTQVMTSMLFYLQGPIMAGKMGATLQMLVALNSVSAAWTSTKAPRFSMLVANKQIRELDKLFFTSTAQSLFVCLIGGLTFLLGLHFLHGKLELVSRFLEVQETALLLIGTVVFQITSAQSSYLRAHKKEPLMWQTVINGVLTLIGIFIFGKLYGAKGVVISYATVQVLNLLCTTAIWRHCKKKWHA